MRDWLSSSLRAFEQIAIGKHQRMPTSNFINHRYLGPSVSVGILILMVLWLLGGTLKSQPSDAAELTQESNTRPLTQVTIALPAVQTLTPSLRVYGQTQAHQHITLRAQREGTITKKNIALGQQVDINTLLAEIDPRDLAAQQTAAEAELAQQKSELEAAKRLQKQKLVGQTRLNEARAAFTLAAANLAQIKSERQLRKITAPFSGRIDEELVDIGDFVQTGTALFRLVDLSQIRVIGEVAEADLHRIFVGQSARITLNATPQTQQDKRLEGTVIHVAKEPQLNTRTYRFEIQLDAPNTIPALGMSTTIELIDSPRPAFLISPALLHLNNHGQLGVKTVDAQGEVSFKAIEIIKASTDGIWVSGLSDKEPVITIGQGYVRVGDTVDPIMANNPLTHSNNAQQ